MKRFAASVLICLAAWATDCPAQQATPMVADEQVEERVLLISDDLRCLVCQNEPLASSGAVLAQDLRREIREQIKAGKSDSEVLDFMVGRYGDFVLYQPTHRLMTLLLWFGSALLLVVGIGALIQYLRHRRNLVQIIG